MANDENEDIIDPDKNNESEDQSADKGSEGEGQEGEKDKGEEKEKKPEETPEAKRARLKRQLAQLDKKHGFKDEPEQKKEEPKGDLTSADTIAIINAKVHEDDIDEVVAQAKFKGITVKEVLAQPIMKTYLAQRQDERETAEATNTGRQRSGQASTTPDALLEKAQRTGEIPEKDEDIEKLVDARLDKKANKK